MVMHEFIMNFFMFLYTSCNRLCIGVQFEITSGLGNCFGQLKIREW